MFSGLEIIVTPTPKPTPTPTHIWTNRVVCYALEGIDSMGEIMRGPIRFSALAPDQTDRSEPGGHYMVDVTVVDFML